MSEIEQRLERLKLELSKTIINSEHQQWRENRINSYRHKAVSIPIQAMAVIPVQPPTMTTTTQTVIKTSINLDDKDDILASITSARQQLVTSLSNPPNPHTVSKQKEIDDDDDEFSTYSDEPKLDTQQKQQPQQRQQHQTQVQTQAATTTASSILKSKDASSLPSPVESSYGTSQYKQQLPSSQQAKSTSARPAAAAYGLFGANKDETLDDIY